MRARSGVPDLVRVTHRFHPLFGRSLEFVKRCKTWQSIIAAGHQIRARLGIGTFEGTETNRTLTAGRAITGIGACT